MCGNLSTLYSLRLLSPPFFSFFLFSQGVNCLVSLPGSRLLSSSMGKELKLWSPFESGSELPLTVFSTDLMATTPAKVQSMASSEDGRAVVLGFETGRMELYVCSEG